MAIVSLIKEQHSLKISLTRKDGMWNIEAKSPFIAKSFVTHSFPSEKELIELLENIEKEIYAA